MSWTTTELTLVSKSSLANDDILLDAGAMEQGALILIDKPAGWTSFDVVNKIRKAAKIKKAGHCGTLDPFATGLLLVLTGAATRRADEFSGQNKVYEFDVFLGTSTDTLDIDGNIIEQSEIVPFEMDRIHSVCTAFVGESEQIPPQFSALKINGTPAYKLARRGREVSLKPRPVTIHSLSILRYSHPRLSLRTLCSKGTYVRALARDIGMRLGCGAHVSSLRRIGSGPFDVADALSLDRLLARLGSHP